MILKQITCLRELDITGSWNTSIKEILKRYLNVRMNKFRIWTGSGRRVGRGYAIPLSHLKEENRLLTVVQKALWEHPAHTTRASSWPLFLLKSHRPGTLLHNGGVWGGARLMLPYASGPWFASWSTSCWGFPSTAPRGLFPDFHPSHVFPAQPPSQPLSLSSEPCCWAFCWYCARALLLPSPFCSAPDPVSPRDCRALSSPLAGKASPSIALSSTLPPNAGEQSDLGSQNWVLPGSCATQCFSGLRKHRLSASKTTSNCMIIRISPGWAGTLSGLAFHAEALAGVLCHFSSSGFSIGNSDHLHALTVTALQWAVLTKHMLFLLFPQ